MATHSSVSASEIPWTEKPGGLQSKGSQRVGRDLATKQQQSQNPVVSMLFSTDVFKTIFHIMIF